jgi:hypothetical protein
MPANPFDVFDPPQRAANLDTSGNPFDMFDAPAALPQPQPQAAAQPQPEQERTWGDTALGLTNALGQGTANGLMATYGLPGGIEWLARKGVNLAGGNVSEETVAPTYSDVKGFVENLTGEQEYKPQTTAEEYARTFGEFAPAIVGPGGLAGKLLSGAGGAVVSETAGQMTEGTAYEPWARVAGGVLGSFAPSTAARMVTPAPAPARTVRDRQILEGEGVHLTAGDRTQAKPLRWAESVAEDTAFAGQNPRATREGQHADFTRAVLQRTGENSDDWRQAIPAARQRLGQTFEQFGQNHDVALDVPMFNALNQAHATYTGLVPPALRAPVVEEILRDLQPAAQALSQGAQPMLNGAQYIAYRSRLNDVLENSADPYTTRAIGGIIEALDDALQRSAGPGAADAIAEARRQYRHLMTVRDVASGAGQETARGYLSPSKLRSVLTGGEEGRNWYTRGQGDLTELATAGESMLKPLGNSGTSPREQVANIMNAIGGMAGAAAGAPWGPVGMTAGAMAGAAAPVVGRAISARTIMNPLIQGYLGNQVLPYRLAPGAGVLGAGIAAPALMDNAQADEAAAQHWLAQALMSPENVNRLLGPQ